MANMAYRFTIGDRFWQPIRGSLILALVLIFLDAVVSGSYLYSLFVCPIWFIVALIRAEKAAMTGSASQGVAGARILIPVITGVIVLVNSTVQNRIAKTSAVRIVEACEQYREANGAYPAKLDDLVPRYLSSIPPSTTLHAGFEITFARQQMHYVVTRRVSRCNLAVEPARTCNAMRGGRVSCGGRRCRR
jgi:hypothetical protein